MPSILAPSSDPDTVVLLPGDRSGAEDCDALVAWHRAHGGVTLLLDGTEWTGLAAIDRPLIARLPPVDEWSLSHLHHLAPSGAIRFDPASRPRTLFLDRDGTIMEDRDYLADPEGVVLLPGAAAGLRMLQAAGIRLVLVSNQSGVGSGRIPPGALERVHARLLDLLRREDVTLDGAYYCVQRTDAGCDCRKPRPGLIHRAVAELGVPLTPAAVVGDKPADIGLARSVGATAFLVTTGYGAATRRDGTTQADFVVDSLRTLARICLDPRGLPVEAPLPSVPPLLPDSP